MGQTLRKILGFKPQIGDAVSGHLDFGVTYDGIVTATNYDSMIMPYAVVNGTTTIQTMWNGDITEAGVFIVPVSKIKHK